MASVSQALASISEGIKEDRLSKRDEMQFALGLMQFQSERAWREEESERQQFAANITMLEADNQKNRKRHASQLINDLANISGTPLIIGNENVESNFEDWQEAFIEAWNPGETEELKYEAGELISLIYNYRLNPDSDSATEDILTHGRMMFQRYLSVTEGHREDPVVEAYAKSGLFGRTYMMKDEQGNYVRDTDRSMVEESKRFYHNLMVTEDLQYKLAQERNEFVTAGDTQIQSDVGGYKSPGERVGPQDYFSEEDLAAFAEDYKDRKPQEGVIGSPYDKGEPGELIKDAIKTMEEEWKTDAKNLTDLRKDIKLDEKRKSDLLILKGLTGISKDNQIWLDNYDKNKEKRESILSENQKKLTELNREISSTKRSVREEERKLSKWAVQDIGRVGPIGGMGLP